MPTYQELIKEGVTAYNNAVTQQEKREAMLIFSKAKEVYCKEVLPKLLSTLTTKESNNANL